MCWSTGKGKVFLYLLPSVGPGADLGVQAVSVSYVRVAGVNAYTLCVS